MKLSGIVRKLLRRSTGPILLLEKGGILLADMDSGLMIISQKIYAQPAIIFDLQSYL